MTTHAVIITYLRDQSSPPSMRSAGSTGHAY
ncbi:Uncharacterised protein [Mycobacterium tuberculosis]|nr:Uncharacterised protein [Mycobacterium tuberculosis]